MVFIGCYFYPGDWIHGSKSNRTILNYNTLSPIPLSNAVPALSALGPEVEFLYPSRIMQREAGYSGTVEPSIIDLKRFHPRKINEDEPRNFHIGRLSRDEPYKHHFDDAALYMRLAKEGCRVRIMGGTVLKPILRGEGNIELIPSCAEQADEFLRGLACFYYRTGEKWFETGGRVVMEAMATGVPVVGHRRGGYVEWISHGQDGFLFDTQAEALNIIRRLKSDLALRLAVGEAARQKAVALFSRAALRKIIDFYLSPKPKMHSLR